MFMRMTTGTLTGESIKIMQARVHTGRLLVSGSEGAAVVDSRGTSMLHKEPVQQGPPKEARGVWVLNGPVDMMFDTKLKKTHGHTGATKSGTISRRPFSALCDRPRRARSAKMDEPKLSPGYPTPHDGLHLPVEHVTPGAVLDVNGGAHTQATLK